LKSCKGVSGVSVEEDLSLFQEVVVRRRIPAVLAAAGAAVLLTVGTDECPGGDRRVRVHACLLEAACLDDEPC
jgi:hypothetical protein